MKIASFVKGLRLLFQRRKVLLENKVYQIPGFKMVAAYFVLFSALSVLFLMAFPPFTVIEALLFPQPYQASFRVPFGGMLSLRLDASLMPILATLWLFLVWVLSSTVLATFLGLYSCCLGNIASEEPDTADHGDTIAKVLHNIRNEPVEYLALFDADGKKVDETTLYNTSRVRPQDSACSAARQQGGYINIHNHPGSCSGFSKEDIVAAITIRASKSIAVAQDLVYTLELTPKCWELDANAICRQFKAAYAHCSELGKTISDEELTAFVLGINATLAEQCGMKLTVEKFNKNQYFRAQLASSPESTTAPAAARNSCIDKSKKTK